MVIGLAVLVVVLAGIVALVIASNRAAKRRVADAADLRARFDEIARRAANVSAGPSFSASAGERIVSCSYAFPTKNTPPTLFIGLGISRDHGAATGAHAADYRASARRKVEGCPKIIFRKERWWDRFGKMLRINREVQTGDAIFDERVYIESDAKDEAVREVVAEQSVRHAIVRLLEAGFHQVSFHEAAREIKINLPNPTRAQIEGYDAAVADLSSIADGLPAFSGEIDKRYWTFAAKIITPAVLLMIAAFIEIINASSSFRTVTSDLQATGFLAGLGAWCVLVPIVALAVRGRSNSFRIFVAVVLTQLAGLPMLTIGSLELANGIADAAPVAHHVATVRRKWTTSGKNKTYYHLEVSSWRRDLTTIELDVDWSTFRDVEQGAQLRVDTSPGAFGWEWIYSIRA